MKKRLYKSMEKRMICGVCGGIAEYFDIDPTIVRLIAAALALLSIGSPIIAYIAAAIIIPEPDDR